MQPDQRVGHTCGSKGPGSPGPLGAAHKPTQHTTLAKRENSKRDMQAQHLVKQELTNRGCNCLKQETTAAGVEKIQRKQYCDAAGKATDV